MDILDLLWIPCFQICMETLTKHYSSMCRSKTVLNHPQSTTIKSPYLPPIPTPPTPDCAQICQEMLLESWCLHARPPHARLIGGLAWGTDQEPRCERCLKEEEEGRRTCHMLYSWCKTDSCNESKKAAC